MKPWENHNLPKALRKGNSDPDIRRRHYLGQGVINAVGKQEAMALGLVDSHCLVLDAQYGKYLAEQFPGARYLKEKPKRNILQSIEPELYDYLTAAVLLSIIPTSEQYNPY